MFIRWGSAGDSGQCPRTRRTRDRRPTGLQSAKRIQKGDSSVYVWLVVGVLFSAVDCFVATLVDKASLVLPWFESGIYAGGPFGILLTVAWLAFPAGRLIFKRITTRPRD
jgi:hypothetical protein